MKTSKLFKAAALCVILSAFVSIQASAESIVGSWSVSKESMKDIGEDATCLVHFKANNQATCEMTVSMNEDFDGDIVRITIKLIYPGSYRMGNGTMDLKLDGRRGDVKVVSVKGPNAQLIKKMFAEYIKENKSDFLDGSAALDCQDAPYSLNGNSLTIEDIQMTRVPTKK